MSSITARALRTIKPPATEPLIPASFPLGRAWHVIYTNPRSEFRAKWGIQALGFDAYAPAYRCEVRHARKVQIVSKPAFTRYVFCSFDIERDGWGSILDVDGVESLIMNDGIPTRIPTAVIDEVKRFEAIGFFDKLEGDSARFNVGEIVRISEGPFQGNNAQFINDARKYVEVMLDFLGQRAKIKLPLEYLEKL